MMKHLTILVAACAALTLTACASRDAISARQAPQPLDTQTLRVDAASPFYHQMALGPVTGTSRFSWFLPEPNRSILRPRFEAALEQAGLAAPDRNQARYVISLDFDQVDGPDFGSHMDAALLGRVWIEDRLTGRVILNEPVSARREAYWPGVDEAGWATGEYWRVFNIFPFFYDSPWFSVGARWDTTYPPYAGPEWLPLVPIRLRETDTELMVGPSGRSYGARSGAERAWQVNALVSDALAAAVMRSMADRGMLQISHVLPCMGGTAMREHEQALLGRGERVSRPVCAEVQDDLPVGAEALRRSR
ncbi:conserved exported hypothetical protein [Oceanicaulis sp. 350]|nr:conserved exported hypothetical protein [Oceanicaulis sp. 350]